MTTAPDMWPSFLRALGAPAPLTPERSLSCCPSAAHEASGGLGRPQRAPCGAVRPVSGRPRDEDLPTCDPNRWHAIENELGRVFRSEHFNLSIRKNETQTVKPMKCREMYELKLREDPLARSSKEPMKPRSSIHAAMAMRSPVISTLFPTPKDMMLRAAELRQTLSLDALSGLPPSERQTPNSPPLATRGASGGGASSFRSGGGGGAPEMRERAPSSGAAPRGAREEESERPKTLTSEEAIDAEIEQTTDAFNELVG